MTTRARGVASVTTCAATAVTMHSLRTTLATPPIHSWARAETWYEQLGPSMAAMAGLRVLALALAAWLSLAIALQVLASLRFGWALRRIADTVSPGWVRRMGHGMAGLTLSAGLAVPIAVPSTPVAVRVAADVPAPLEPADGDGIAVMRPEPEEAPAPSATTTPTPGAAVPTTAPTPPVAPTQPAAPTADAARPRPASREVRPGDSCWALAAHHLEDSLGAPQPERAIREVWLRLIELNRDRFVTGDPDVIYPGQVLLLPDVER